ncbi:hypothetical protein K402DRAFT_393829 [Aulographum hederae CBS 113979]|uniref:P-loop containing nucleoside triphosphate hydrolase protein n=1 Tax=Aulographum hederae CBS 113979 TaxID=1176131 RepID=A0A6G1H052_9PEZI|nr:hypothetical protein K402DRAFT_393829 [Aulographum hederae CBS 113979]
MTRRDTLQCVHEPFGDAFYFGPERLSPRYEQDEQARIDCGFADSTFKTIFDRIDRENTEGKRIFIKDMAQYFVPLDRKPVSIAPSLVSYKRGVGTNGAHSTEGGPGAHVDTMVSLSPDAIPVKEASQDSNGSEYTSPPRPYPTVVEPKNPTVAPEALLRQFHFTFLIRHPRYSIPSYYRCTIPPLDEVTGFYNFMPNEAGYDELRRMFDFLRGCKQVGPGVCGRENGASQDEANGHKEVDICVIDADDLLDNPAGIIEMYCGSVGIKYEPEMLTWDSEEDHQIAKAAFEKWQGFHDDAIASTELKKRDHKKKPKSDDECYAEWVQKFGEEGAKVIKQTVADNVGHYEYLKQFAIKAS